MKHKTIDHILRSVWMAVSKMYQEEALKLDSTMATGFTLISIDPEQGSPSTALGPKMGMEATSLSRILKSMEERGLITRKPHPEDGRSVLICLTEFGQEMREYSKDIVLGFDQMVRQKISEADLKIFSKVAESIMDLAQNNNSFSRNKTF
ncbi:MAG: MarR family transcriptional regulator [Flavobacteriaceae bacterium]|jgi:DNA-binding MarR family transcriptional regulator|nr:MarR family transcriptional regulator [Flavobacteriaceae bacterium]MDB2463764.1 MarR family transcriptional regulator [Flavobacteriaceae bacterium]MDB2586417.1 MarR family transcriptional regulator [Flavobacteriaceae bacterium]MDC0408740.1 MarR family transcriptional regulator [Flavobacteriaceae bacterium]MDC3341220.1 MarR family transcriptional regulator [Flavobacteriaceae bacterium]